MPYDIRGLGDIGAIILDSSFFYFLTFMIIRNWNGLWLGYPGSGNRDRKNKHTTYRTFLIDWCP